MVTGLVVGVLVFMGVYSSWYMPVDLFPNLEVPLVNIISHYPGAAPEDMEMLVSRPIEDEMRVIPGVKRVASISVQGLSRVTVEFTWGTTVEYARQLVQARLARLRSLLPAGVTPRLENIGTTLQEVCGYVFYGGGNPVALRRTVRHDIAGRLMGVPGVSSIKVLGGDRRAFVVTLRPEELVRFRISVADIVAALKRHNVNVVAGFVAVSGREYLVRGDARLKTLEDVRAVPVGRDADGRPILLGMIADVLEGRVPRHYVVHGDGVPAVALVVRKQPGASTVSVVKNVDRVLLELRHLLPAGTVVKKFYDQSEIIREAREQIFQALIIGAFLAVFVLWFFLGALRPTLVVAVTIPLTLIATVALMRLFGLGFNMITMTALALAVGMIVDDAIVVAENIFRHGRTTADPVAASISGAVEIAGPDATGTFTTMAAFLPLVVTNGMASLFLRPFGLTVSIALFVSLALSLTLIPLLFSRSRAPMLLKESFPGSRLLRRFDAALQKMLGFSFKHARETIIIALLVSAAAGLATVFMETSFLPPIDEGALLVEYVMPPGTSLEESNRVGEMVERIALADPDVSCVYRRTGSPGNSYQVEGVNKGEMLVKLRPEAERSRSAWEIAAALKEKYSKIPGCVFSYRQPTQEKIEESFSGLPALFGVTVYGSDMEKLVSLAGRITSILSTDPGISSVLNTTRAGVTEVDVRPDYALLAMNGVAPHDVLTELQAAYKGVEATRIVRQREEIPVIVKLDTGEHPGIETIQELPVTGRDGTAVPLKNVTSVRIHRVPAVITRLNGQREITIVADVKGSFSGIISRLRKKFSALALPRGYSIEFGGRYRVIFQTAVEMFFVMMCAVGLVYLIMVMQFGSWLQPLAILVTIPLAIVGAVIALFITGHALDVSVGMGVMTLAGIAVNNAILLLDYANKRKAFGICMKEALLFAASVRLRPILLTTFTTIAALLPAAVGTGMGSRMFQSFAITVIGGLVTSLIATLLVAPTLAVMFPQARQID